MPVFECVRCNNLTYSASRFASIDCDKCGAARHRTLEHAFSFAEARSAPRTLGAGDHCCAGFDAPQDIVPLCVQVITTALGEGARVLAHPPAALREAIGEALEQHQVDAVEWADPSTLYDEDFDPDEVVRRFRQLAEAEERPVYVLGGADIPLARVTTPEEFGRFERLATEAAIDTDMVVVCLYDRSVLGAEFVTIGDETHPLAGPDGDAVRRNERFAYASAESSPSST